MAVASSVRSQGGSLRRYLVLLFLVPLGYLFGFTLHGGLWGIWMAFPFGLTTAGVLYMIRFLKR